MRLSIVAFAALAAMPPFAASANVFAVDGKDPRHVQPRQATPFAAIGMIENLHPIPVIAEDERVRYAQGRATAFLVSPCLAVTNFHAVYGEQAASDLRRRDYTVTFLAGAGPGDDGFSARSHAEPVFHGDFDENREGQDWVVLRLDRCLGAELGWLSLPATTPDGAPDAASVSLAGYPSGKDPDHLWRQDRCRLISPAGEADLWTSDCAAEPGASGSPVFAMRGGAPTVMGIMEGAEEDRPALQPAWSRQASNLVVDIRSVLARADVRAAIAADIAGHAAQRIDP